jgi:hypothetical protein
MPPEPDPWIAIPAIALGDEATDFEREVAAAAGELYVMRERRFSSRGRLYWKIGPAYSWRDVMDERYALVTATFLPLAKWSERGEWVWAANCGKGCAHPAATYVALTKAFEGWPISG